MCTLIESRFLIIDSRFAYFFCLLNLRFGQDYSKGFKRSSKPPKDYLSERVDISECNSLNVLECYTFIFSVLSPSLLTAVFWKDERQSVLSDQYLQVNVSFVSDWSNSNSSLKVTPSTVALYLDNKWRTNTHETPWDLILLHFACLSLPYCIRLSTFQ